MVVLGLLILLVALALGTLLVMGAGSPDVAAQDVEISLFDTVQVTLNPLALVIAGMAVMFLAWLGLVLIRTTLTRKARTRRERKEEARLAQERQAAALREREAAERDHEAKLKEQRMATETARERAEVAEEEAGRAPAADRDRHVGDRHLGDRRDRGPRA